VTGHMHACTRERERERERERDLFLFPPNLSIVSLATLSKRGFLGEKK